MTVYRVGGVTVTVDDERQCIVHRWPDGLELVVRPDLGPGSLDDFALASRLGYFTRTDTGWDVHTDDLWRMHVDHEVGHHWLAVFEGWDWSPALDYQAKKAADPDTHEQNMARDLHEERAVLAFQLGLPKPGPRPWDGAAQ